MCSSGWGNLDASVACYQLGYSSTGIVMSIAGIYDIILWVLIFLMRSSSFSTCIIFFFFHCKVVLH